MKKRLWIILIAAVAVLAAGAAVWLTRAPAVNEPVASAEPAEPLATAEVSVPVIANVTETVTEKGDREITYENEKGEVQTITILTGNNGEDPGQTEAAAPEKEDLTVDTGAADAKVQAEESGVAVGVITENGGGAYADYMNLSPEEQYAYFLTYENPEDFVAWFNAVKAEYEASHAAIEIGNDDIIDFSSPAK